MGYPLACMHRTYQIESASVCAAASIPGQVVAGIARRLDCLNQGFEALLVVEVWRELGV